MAAENLQDLDDNIVRQERYAFSSSDAHTMILHASRTADRQAAFFLPYLQPGMSLLDCGSGSGSITVGLAQVIAPGQVTGIDISADEVTRARDRAAAERIANVHFEVGNVYKLAFPAESFDAVFAHNVLEHVDAPLKALQEMHRVLKPGGMIGIRDLDFGGTIVYAASELVTQYLHVHEVIWERASGDPRIGRRLRGLLHEAGFVDVAATASFDVHSDPEGLWLFSQVIVSRFEEPDFLRQVIDLGLAGREKVEEIKAAWQVWPEDPAAFAARAHCEVVGRKQ